jgi:hypothetical protein
MPSASGPAAVDPSPVLSAEQAHLRQSRDYPG